MIELPLKYPQVFERLGIGAPKGVFLYGPPGTGKTLIARAVIMRQTRTLRIYQALRLWVNFTVKAEARLRGVFEDAQKHAPAIIFIDEIDSIAPKKKRWAGRSRLSGGLWLSSYH